MIQGRLHQEVDAICPVCNSNSSPGSRSVLELNKEA